LAANLMFEIAITKYLGRPAPGQQSRCGRELNDYTPPAKITAGPNNRLHASRLVVSRL
jgi:hypothetical protein